MSMMLSRTLEVRCLGAFAVHDEGRRLGPWTNRRATSVLKHLVLAQGPVPRDVLMESLWPDLAPPAARNNLHGAVHALRRVLGDAAQVVHEGGCYALAPELDVWNDVAEFERLVRDARRRTGPEALDLLEAADALYAGPLFEDDPYEDWMQPRRRELEALRLEVLDRLAERHLALGDVHAWSAVARRIVLAEPWREEVQRELMTCYARRGQSGRALRQYQECATALREALGVGPDPDTEELRARIARREVV